MLTLLIALLSFAFGAGGALFAIKQVRTDVNGLGRLVRDNEKKTADQFKDDAKKNGDRFERLEMALLLVSKNDPERRKIAEFLDGRRDG